jgi:hypothetical protein
MRLCAFRAPLHLCYTRLFYVSIALQFRFDNFGFFYVIQNFTYPKITILENETLFTLLLPGICYVTKQFGERACFDDV